MYIKVWDRVTYINKPLNKICMDLIFNKGEVDRLEHFKHEILKVERIGENGWYTVYKKEEKKELLTEEEREFLKSYINFSQYNNLFILNTENILKVLCDSEVILEIIGEEKFKGLEYNKQYSISELGLEE